MSFLSVFSTVVGVVSHHYKKKRYGEFAEWQYEYLNQQPMLHSSAFLEVMFESTTKKEHHMLIFDYMNKHDVLELGDYEKLSNQIVDKWRG